MTKYIINKYNNSTVSNNHFVVIVVCGFISNAESSTIYTYVITSYTNLLNSVWIRISSEPLKKNFWIENEWERPTRISFLIIYLFAAVVVAENICNWLFFQIESWMIKIFDFIGNFIIIIILLFKKHSV